MKVEEKLEHIKIISDFIYIFKQHKMYESLTAMINILQLYTHTKDLSTIKEDINKEILKLKSERARIEMNKIFLNNN